MEGGVRASCPEITMAAAGCKASHRDPVCEKQVPSKGTTTAAGFGC